MDARLNASPLCVFSIWWRVKNCLFLDVGANIGVYSVLIGSKMGPGSKIIAFEPNPDVAARLRRNLELNGLDAMTQVEGVALGSAESTGMLSISRRNQGRVFFGDAARRGGA